ncbi:MAG: response regulator [Steroidobacter sp.]
MKQNDVASRADSVQVLIVDDNEDAAMSLTMLLELEDIAAATAADAAIALELLNRISPRLMLIDIGLPGMNGFELAQRLRERPDTREITLIALTGREGGEQEPEAAVFNQFWTKPFDPRKLLAEVKSLVDRSMAADCGASAYARQL